MAVWSPETGIVDWAGVTISYGMRFTKAGGKVHLNFPVAKFQSSPEASEYPVSVYSSSGKVRIL
jgi:L-2-hydroxyglutarate oxidase LhgO